MMMMVMVMMMMMMCKRLAQVLMLCVPIYNMKWAMMQKTPIFITFSAHTKMAADKRGQIEVFARNLTHTTHKNGDDWGWFMALFLPHCTIYWSVAKRKICWISWNLNWYRGDMLCIYFVYQENLGRCNIDRRCSWAISGTFAKKSCHIISYLNIELSVTRWCCFVVL